MPLEEAIETLRDRYENRLGRLNDALGSAELVEDTNETPVEQVWSMSGQIENRTNQLIEEATEEVVLVVGDESLLTEKLVGTLDALDDDVDLMVGAVTESLERPIESRIPDATTFTSGLDWLYSDASGEEETGIGRLLLADRSTILVSPNVLESGEERAVFWEGFGNGLVVIARRIMAQGLLTARDPAQ